MEVRDSPHFHSIKTDSLNGRTIRQSMEMKKKNFSIQLKRYDINNTRFHINYKLKVKHVFLFDYHSVSINACINAMVTYVHVIPYAEQNQYSKRAHRTHFIATMRYSTGIWSDKKGEQKTNLIVTSVTVVALSSLFLSFVHINSRVVYLVASSVSLDKHWSFLILWIFSSSCFLPFQKENFKWPL